MFLFFLILLYHISMKNFDIIIIGGGVAGMSAAIYAKRRGKKVVIIEKYTLGGQALSIQKIENFPSQSSIDGLSLIQMFSNQVLNLGIDIILDEINSKKIFGKKDVYQAKSIIIATGLSYIDLGINEYDFLGQGVSFCAVCDANFFKNQDVFVASRAGSGILGAKTLAEVCKSVTILDSQDLSIFQKANKDSKISVISNSKVKKLIGKGKLQKIQLEIDGALKMFNANALFIELGKKPYTDIFDVNKDENGFIITDETMKTNVNGVFAIGDVRSKMLKQIITACSDGAIAGQNA